MINHYIDVLSGWINNGHALPGDYHKLLVNSGSKFIPIVLISWKGSGLLKQATSHIKSIISGVHVGSFELDASVGSYHMNLLEQVHCFKPWWTENLHPEARKRYPENGLIYFSIYLSPSSSLDRLRSFKNI